MSFHQINTNLSKLMFSHETDTFLHDDGADSEDNFHADDSIEFVSQQQWSAAGAFPFFNTLLSDDAVVPFAQCVPCTCICTFLKLLLCFTYIKLLVHFFFNTLPSGAR